MRDGLIVVAGFDVDLAAHALHASWLVRRHITEDVLISRLFGDLQECTFHVPSRATTVNVSACRSAIHAQDARRPFSQSVVGCDGIHLNARLKQLVDVLLDWLRVAGACNLTIRDQKNHFAEGFGTRFQRICSLVHGVVQDSACLDRLRSIGTGRNRLWRANRAESDCPGNRTQPGRRCCERSPGSPSGGRDSAILARSLKLFSITL